MRGAFTASKAPYVATAKTKGVSTVHALMMGDYLSPPTVTEVDLYYYHGRIGDEVRVRATDDFEVVGVTVSTELTEQDTGARVPVSPARDEQCRTGERQRLRADAARPARHVRLT